MIVTDIQENADGSATITLDLSQEEQNVLIQKGFITILEDYIKNQTIEQGDIIDE